VSILIIILLDALSNVLSFGLQYARPCMDNTCVHVSLWVNRNFDQNLRYVTVDLIQSVLVNRLTAEPRD
jgi:hypothetical protein